MAAALAATACVEVLASPSVVPSGSDRATCSVPRLPPPPTRFSTTSCWPSRSPSFWATSRATMSELLPAVNGTTKRIGRSGQRLVCACAMLAPSSATTTAVVPRKRGPSDSGPRALYSPRSCDPLGLAQALDQRRAQQERARSLGVLGSAAQLVVILAPHRRILL